MKIVFITSAFYPSIGGVETHVLQLSKELTRLGHKVTVVTEDKPEYWQSRFKSDNEAGKLKSIDKTTLFTRKRLDQIDIYYFKFGQPSFFKKFKIWYSFLKNIKLFQEAEIIHCHDVFIWYLPLRFLHFQKKVFTTFHGYETVFPPEKKAIYLRRLSAWLSYGTIFVGDYIKKWYGTNPDIVTYGGVKEVHGSRFTVHSSTRRRKLRILLIGRLEKDIGVRVYRGALRKLKEIGVTYEFIACGGGSLTKEMEGYGQVFGFVRKLKTYMKKADIVFCSSYLTMLEVLQVGKPIFAAYTNPLKHDYLCDSPFKDYIKVSHDASTLTKQILKYKPNLRKIEQGAKWANSQTWENVAQVYLELWNKK